METSASAEPSAQRRSSVPLTAAIGGVVVVVSVVFAFASAWYTDWYAVFRVLHVVLAVFWVGGGLLLTMLGLRAERSDDPEAGNDDALRRRNLRIHASRLLDRFDRRSEA